MTDANVASENNEALERLQHFAGAWHVAVDRVVETATSVVGFGVQTNQRVVLKVVKSQGDEWYSGAVLAAFRGRGVARVLNHVAGALLIEELDPGTSLATLSLGGRDAEAAEIIAQVISAMQTANETPLEGFPTVEDWGHAFDRQAARGIGRIPEDLFEEARARYSALCRTQGARRLLHGDMQHYNILFDHRRGWTAIDPKGVVGEAAYELGAAMRNPVEMPELFTSSAAVERRIEQYVRLAGLDFERIAGWTFAQAVLSAVWVLEDEDDIGWAKHVLELAQAVRPLLPST